MFKAILQGLLFNFVLFGGVVLMLSGALLANGILSLLLFTMGLVGSLASFQILILINK
jgi:hypothetical protein